MSAWGRMRKSLRCLLPATEREREREGEREREREGFRGGEGTSDEGEVKWL